MKRLSEEKILWRLTLFPRRSLSSAILAAGFDVEMTLAPTRVKNWKHDQYMNDEPATGFECGTVLRSGECHWSAAIPARSEGGREKGVNWGSVLVNQIGTIPRY